MSNAKQITEADVVAFLAGSAQDIAAQVKAAFCIVAVSQSSSDEGTANWLISTNNRPNASSETLAGCIAKLNPECQAQELRKQAANLLAEADKLNPRVAA